MKVTKYPQSHLVIEKNGFRIMIDPGNVTFANGFSPEEFQGCDGYLITHTHSDHLDPENIRIVVGDNKVFGNEDVVNKLKELGIEGQVVKNKETFKVGEFEIIAVDLPHCALPEGMGEPPPNTGFIIDGVLFDPGDGYEAPEQLKVDNMVLAITGPTITTEGAIKFAQDLGVKVVIPIHYNGRFKADPEDFAKEATKLGMEIRILNFGEETEV